MTALRAAFGSAIVLSLCGAPAAAVTVDGQLDAEYGPPVVLQTLQTGLSSGQITGDNNRGELEFANGSELDACHAIVSGGVLSLFLSGNLALVLNQNQNGTNGHVLDVFVDSGPGGQNVLNGLGAGHPLNGMALDAGFEPDHLFEFHGDGDRFSVSWFAAHAQLQSGGGNAPVSLGVGAAGGPGTLVGGTNPHGIQVTIDNSNVGGVTFGCAASSGAGVTRGVEWRIPLAAIGNPQGCFRVAAIVRDRGSQSPVSNSVLAPAPAGTCPLGSAASVNFAAIAGEQNFEICPDATAAPGPGAAGGGLALAAAGANPARAGSLRLAFSVPDARPATLRLFDGAGRIVRERAVSGSGIVDLSEGRPLPSGLYWARLAHGGSAAVRRLCVVR